MTITGPPIDLGSRELWEVLARALYTVFTMIRDAVSWLMAETIFKADPELASLYGDVASALAMLTALYIVLEFFALGRKIVKAVLILSWAMLFISMLLAGL